MKKNLHNDICEDSMFRRIYEELVDNLHNHLYYKYGERLDPSDKTQEAFIKLWENCKKVTPAKAKSFLYTVANNLMLNEIKHQKVVLKYQKEKTSQENNESPEFLLQKDEYFKKYQEVLARLSEEQRSAFLLNKVEGKKHVEIAELLGITKKKVEYRIYSAFKVLKTELEDFNIK